MFSSFESESLDALETNMGRRSQGFEHEEEASSDTRYVAIHNSQIFFCGCHIYRGMMWL